MKFALFFLAEYINVFIVCAIGAHPVPGWLDAAISVQTTHFAGYGLDPVKCLVFQERRFPEVFPDHVVPLDLPAFTD